MVGGGYCVEHDDFLQMSDRHPEPVALTLFYRKKKITLERHPAKKKGCTEVVQPVG
jgi:hypothetical protein